MWVIEGDQLHHFEGHYSIFRQKSGREGKTGAFLESGPCSAAQVAAGLAAAGGGIDELVEVQIDTARTRAVKAAECLCGRAQEEGESDVLRQLEVSVPIWAPPRHASAHAHTHAAAAATH